jgi:hypothetical protein
MNPEAQYYNALPDLKVQCNLCPQNCLLSEGKSGICRVRVNNQGKLITEVYGYVSCIPILLRRNHCIIFFLVQLSYLLALMVVICDVIFARIAAFHKQQQSQI